MSKFVCVNEAPKNLSKEEYVIEQANFFEEVKTCEKKKPRQGYMTNNYLREIAAAIGFKYLGEDFNPFSHVNATLFEGVPFSNNEEAAKIALDLFKKDCPQVFDKYLEFKIKNRPFGIKVIYFVGALQQAGVFFKNGFDQISLKEVNQFLSKKAKKNNEAEGDSLTEQNV